MKPLYVRLPVALLAEVRCVAKQKDLKMAAVVKQALILWLEENE